MLRFLTRRDPPEVIDPDHPDKSVRESLSFELQFRNHFDHLIRESPNVEDMAEGRWAPTARADCERWPG